MHSATLSSLCLADITAVHHVATVLSTLPAGQMKKADASQIHLLQPTLNPANELGPTNSRTLKKSIIRNQRTSILTSLRPRTAVLFHRVKTCEWLTHMNG